MEPANKQVVDIANARHVALDTDESTSAQQRPNPENEGLPRVQLTETTYTRYIKTIIDRSLALCALIVFAVPMLMIGMLVLVSMGSPILFQQRRIGLNGKPFDVLKFRTMGRDRRIKDMFVQHEDRITHKSDKDPRHTRVGKILRRYSLDELPQLINIIRGDMSIVGPRPELESVVKAKYPENLEQRHLVRPGLTGLWQISARGDGPMHENGEWDLKYVEQISPLTDIAIVLKTPFAMLGRNKGG